jgi:CRP-like cAMP-binding protein/cytochrome P450
MSMLNYDSDDSKEARRPPLVRGLPFFGNTFQFLRDTSRLLDDSYRRYGPVFRLRALWLKYTVIAGFEARDFLQQGLAEKYLSRHKIFDAVGEQLGHADFVLGQSGDRHTRLRRLLALAYSRELASPFVPDFIDATRRIISVWKSGSIRSVVPVVKRIAFEQYCRVMCGGSLEAYYDDILTVTEYNMNIGGRVWPFFLYKAPWYQSARKRVLKAMWSLLRERQSTNLNPDIRKTIMDTLMGLRDEKGSSLNEDEAVCYSMYGFAGSASYMSRLVAFMLYEILKNPGLRESLVDEVDQAFSAGLKTARDVRRMELLTAVYNETLRFHPVSQGMPFYAERDFIYEGKKVCAGDITVLSQVPMSFSGAHFSDPLRFDHARMLGPRNEHRSGRAFHPYGIAHRTCTAGGLVELMAVTMVATILHDKCVEMTPAGYDLKLTVRPLPAPDNRFSIKTAPRSTTDRGRGALLSEENATATFPGYDDPYVLKALESSPRRIFEKGMKIIREGDPAEHFYIIERGMVSVTSARGKSEEIVAQLQAGQYFGEIGLLHGVPRTASITVTSDIAQVLEVPRESFMAIIEHSDLISSEMAAIVRKRTATNSLHHALPGLPSEAITRIFPEFAIETREAGSLVIREGDAAERFYIVVNGFVLVTRGTAETGIEELARLHSGEYFGEIGLLTDSPRTATVAISDDGPATLLSTDRKGFQLILHASDEVAEDLAQTMLRRISEFSS